jgi:hypothetical protein
LDMRDDGEKLARSERSSGKEEFYTEESNKQWVADSRSWD